MNADKTNGASGEQIRPRSPNISNELPSPESGEEGTKLGTPDAAQLFILFSVNRLVNLNARPPLEPEPEPKLARAWQAGAGRNRRSYRAEAAEARRTVHAGQRAATRGVQQ